MAEHVDGSIIIKTIIDTSDVGKALNSLDKGVDKVSDSFEDAEKASLSFGDVLKANILSDAVVSGFSRLTDAIGGFVSGSISTAAELKAEASQLEQTFGSMEGTATEVISSIADETGTLETRLNGAATSIYAFARSSGGSELESMDLMEGALTAAAWSRAWDGVKEIFKGVWNGIIGLLEGAVNIIIKGVNWLISQLNKIHFEIPDWVPGIGGNSFGINIPPVNEIEIPRLARGAVIPPNREFLAVLGDQKQGTNIETPLPTMVQAFKQALSEMGITGESTIILEVDGQQFGKAVFRHYNSESRRIGATLISR